MRETIANYATNSMQSITYLSCFGKMHSVLLKWHYKKLNMAPQMHFTFNTDPWVRFIVLFILVLRKRTLIIFFLPIACSSFFFFLLSKNFLFFMFVIRAYALIFHPWYFFLYEMCNGNMSHLSGNVHYV